jgi:ABC-2 type transport system ATP-binding protein
MKMIEVQGVSKSFDRVKALSCLDMNIKKGSIYGLIGVNGSGKTTILKHITGILRPDEGRVVIDGEDIFDNTGIKARTGFIPDDLFFFGNYNLKESAAFYSRLYPKWNFDIYNEVVSKFVLDEKRKLSRFSKGMQKQAAFALNMAISPDFLILDEPIDGLDPIVRKLVWNLIVDGVAEREMTVLVSSHNLREMEGICDSIGILSNGKMLIERGLDELKSDVHKVQTAFPAGVDRAGLYGRLNILQKESRGEVDLLIVREPGDKIDSVIGEGSPLVFDILPLTLEEIFIYEIGGGSDDIKSILF